MSTVQCLIFVQDFFNLLIDFIEIDLYRIYRDRSQKRKTWRHQLFLLNAAKKKRLDLRKVFDLFLKRY